MLQPFFLVGAPNFGPAAAAPAGPAPTALFLRDRCHFYAGPDKHSL